MSIQTIAAFSSKARSDAELAGKLKECQKLRELIKLACEEGFEVDEELFYPPNEPQFTAEQLSEKLANALLRA